MNLSIETIRHHRQSAKNKIKPSGGYCALLGAASSSKYQATNIIFKQPVRSRANIKQK